MTLFPFWEARIKLIICTPLWFFSYGDYVIEEWTLSVTLLSTKISIISSLYGLEFLIHLKAPASQIINKQWQLLCITHLRGISLLAIETAEY